MAPLRRQLVAMPTNLILRHVRTEATGQDRASLSILAGGWDAVTEKYCAGFTDAKDFLARTVRTFSTRSACIEAMVILGRPRTLDMRL